MSVAAKAELTPQQEATAFTDMVERYIRQFSNNEAIGCEVEAAIINLEVQHTRHVNAVKREFNHDLETLESAQKHNLGILKEREDQHDRENKKKMAQITGDYARQLAQSTESSQKRLRELKAHYEEMLAEERHRAKTVAEVQQLSDKEIARLKEEHSWVIGLKDKEIAALERRLNDIVNGATTELDETDHVRRQSEEENNALRREVQALRQQLLKKNDNLTAGYKATLEGQERILAHAKKLATENDTVSAEGKVLLSQLRAATIARNFEVARAKVREAEANGGSAVKDAQTPATTEADDTEALDRKMEQLMDALITTQQKHQNAATIFQTRLTEECDRTKSQWKRQQELADQEEKAMQAELERSRSVGKAEGLVSFKDPMHFSSAAGCDSGREASFLRRSRRNSSLRSAASLGSARTYGNSTSGEALSFSGKGVTMGSTKAGDHSARQPPGDSPAPKDPAR